MNQVVEGIGIHIPSDWGGLVGEKEPVPCLWDCHQTNVEKNRIDLDRGIMDSQLSTGLIETKVQSWNTLYTHIYIADFTNGDENFFQNKTFTSWFDKCHL